MLSPNASTASQPRSSGTRGHSHPCGQGAGERDSRRQCATLASIAEAVAVFEGQSNEPAAAEARHASFGASACGGTVTTFATQASARFVQSNRDAAYRSAAGTCRVVLPNPSLKLSPNCGPRGPGRRYAVHFRQPGPRVPPSVPA